MQVEEIIESFSNKSIDFHHSKMGNRGDGIIYMGCKTLFDKYNVQCNEFDESQKAEGKTLFIRPSGGFCFPYSRGVDRALKYVDSYEEIFILPSSFDVRYRKIRDFIVNLPAKVTIFCREKYSYQNILKCSPNNKKVFLDHDMAFQMDYSKWENKGKGVLRAFRNDLDRGMKQRFSDAVDISRGGPWEWEELLKIVSQYDEIHSDRLHVCIPAAMLKKKAYVYPNRYYKIKGIYEYSLADFENVQWVDVEVRKAASPKLVRLLEMSQKYLSRNLYNKIRSSL